MNTNYTGYTKGSNTEKNSYNIIPSNNITMKKVKGTVLAIKLDKDGKPVGMKFMKPNKDYKFDGAHSVMEIPKYQGAGTYRTQEPGSFFQYDEKGNKVSAEDPGVLTEEQSRINNEIQQGYNSEIDFSLPGSDGSDLGAFEIPEGQEYLDSANEELRFANTLEQDEVSDDWLNKEIEKLDKGLEEDPNSYTEGLELRDRPNIQFYNQYAGVDIPTAAAGLGSNIESGNALGIVANAAKLTIGLGRNITGGIGQERRRKYAMKEYWENQNKPIEQYMKKGGKITKEAMLTGEYIQGVDQDVDSKLALANAEVEAGEYIKTNEGDIAQVVGRKHSEGEISGEKLPLEEGETILSADTKLGAKNAKNIRDNFDINVRAKNTYTNVLDKFRTKIGLNSLLKEEEGILKSLEEEEGKEDNQTKGLNETFLRNKLKDIRSQKEPIEEARKMLYDSLFKIQELSKPNAERVEELKTGGMKEYQDGGYYYVDVDGRIEKRKRGKNVTQAAIDYSKELEKELASGTGRKLTEKVGEYDSRAVENAKLDGLPEAKAVSPLKPLTAEDQIGVQKGVTLDYLNNSLDNVYEAPNVYEVPEDTIVDDREGKSIMTLPDQYPNSVRGLEPHLKTQRRFDRIAPTKVDPRPYLNRIYEQQKAEEKKLESLSPSVREAARANIGANVQRTISDTMAKIDSTNLRFEERANMLNTRTQKMEENARVADDLSFEQRQLTAKAKTDFEIDEYFDKIDQVNLGNYSTINALNNANARSSDIQYDGQGYVVADKPKIDMDLFKQYEKDQESKREYEEFLKFKEKRSKK